MGQPFPEIEGLQRAGVGLAQGFGAGTALRGEEISTLVLTALLTIGLFFFLRASAKERVETRWYGSSRGLEEMGSALRAHLQGRAYRLQSADAQGIATFVGQARGSVGLALFLTGLAAAGLACLALVLHTLEPGWGSWPWAAVLAAPWAGWFYSRRSRRPEQIRVKLQETDSAGGSRLWVQGQREELDVLAAALGLEEQEPELEELREEGG